MAKNKIKNKPLFMFIKYITIVLLIIPGMQVMAQAPTATTDAATAVGWYDATLNGTVNANGLSTTVYFEYGETTGYGSTWTAAESPVTGSTNTAVSAALAELSANTLYHYRVVATNASGTTYGGDMTFTTSQLPPAVFTLAATGVGASNATLNGTVNARGISTTISFEYGTDTTYGTTVTADQSPLSSTSTIPVTATITGLANNTIYHFRVTATNAGGTSYGSDMTFTIGTAGSAPTATTNAATGIGTNAATLNGTVNAGSLSTAVIFEYGTTVAYGSFATAVQSPVTGSTDTAVSASLAEFVPNTTYHFRVVATNTLGTVNGADMTFTTQPLAPTATTNAASSVGSTTATLNGTVNANGASTTVTFQYGLTTAYGTTVTAAQSPVTGSTNTAVSRAISGLTNGLTYHYRVVAVNAGGTTYGADGTFKTGAVVPAVTTNAASGVSTTAATLNGTVNANGNSTTVTFQYGLTTNYNRTVSAVPGTVTGTSNTAVTAALSGLTPNMTYHYRVVASNVGGTAYGADITFTTGSGPAVTTEAASGISTHGATLNGTVNAKNNSTAVTIEYGLTTAYGTTVTADQSPVTGTADTAVSITLTSILSPNTAYHYRVVGQNSGGTTYGVDITFTTAAPDPEAPLAVTGAAAGVTPTTATLTGTVTSMNHSTVVTFEYGTSTGYGTTVTAAQSPVTSVSASAVSYNLTGLTAGITYHYRVVAQNAYGTAYGADMTFFTAVPVISAVTDAATGVTATTATLNGTVDPAGSFVTVSFEYGPDTGYGSTVNATPGLLASASAVTASLSGLTAGNTYHYRVVLRDAFPPNNVLAYGGDMTFTTVLPPTVVTNAASGIGTTSATLNGTVNSNGGSTTVTFQYGEDTNYGRTATVAQSPVTGSTNTAVSSNLTTLSPNTLYHYRVATEKEGVIVYGADTTFTTTGAAPSADTNAATAVTTSGATLNGTVNANNDSTTVTFQYGLTTAYGSTTTASQSPVSGVTNTAVSSAITGLTSSTMYHFRVVAQNSTGTTYGGDMTFFTGTTAPTVTTTAATGVGPTVATLNGTVNANNNDATVTFEYGETTAYGRTVSGTPGTVTGSAATAVSAALTGLASGTTYHYRAVGQNAAGTGTGADMTFTTNVVDTPTVTTAEVTNISATSADSGGNVTDEGGGPVTARGVCWSTAPNPTTADNITSDGTGGGAFTSSLTGLSEVTTYYVRAYATNAYGTVYGDELQFTTNSINTPTVTTLAVTKITANSAASGGNITDDGGSPVTARGVCWSTTSLPTTANNKTSNGTGVGSFTAALTNLSPETTYYVRAYAVNAAGTAYGGELAFTTKSTTVNVDITEPGNGDTVSGTITIAASASVSSSDSSGTGETSALSISVVEFYIDDVLLAEVTTSPYETTWDTTAYTDGSHTIRAVAYDQDNNTAEDQITVTVSNGGGGNPSEILLNRTNLNFASLAGAVTTSAQTMLIDNIGTGALNWKVAGNAAWLAFSPASSSGPGVVNVSVDPSGLAAGTYSAELTITDPNASNSPVTLPVNFVILPQGTASSPFGVFDTPIDDSSVTGSIPVTGWALDDIEVASVKIYRAPVDGEDMEMVFIGDAVFVEGARPDVEAAYSTYPLNYRSGWGYMLLTYGLPNQGNGTFILYAEATDAEGNTTILGQKTIYGNNTDAVKPFGAIDAPGQGGTASGASFLNYGWALTPQPNTIPTDGSTILVWVDGVPVGGPVYNQYRPDVAALFPGYNNTNGAGGLFHLDTTPYTNGVHTISWTVEDNGGNAEGIGSRYFIIQNTGSSNRAKQDGPTAAGIPVNNSLLPSLSLTTGETNRLSVKPLEHVIVNVGENFSSIRGFLEVNDRLDPLPIGSTLDAETGFFYWEPGPGFTGRFPLVFVIESSSGWTYKRFLTIEIEPK